MRNKITKCHSDCKEGEKIVSVPWLQPSLGPKRCGVVLGVRGKSRACLKSLDPPYSLWSQEIARGCRGALAEGRGFPESPRGGCRCGGRYPSAPSREAAAG